MWHPILKQILCSGVRECVNQGTGGREVHSSLLEGIISHGFLIQEDWVLLTSQLNLVDT